MFKQPVLHKENCKTINFIDQCYDVYCEGDIFYICECGKKEIIAFMDKEIYEKMFNE
jgi:hypothetical protein